jgi:hypothetical protein
VGFQHESTLTGYARAATDARIHMAEYTSGPWFPEYVRDWFAVRFAHGDRQRVFRDAALADFARFSTRVWQTGQSNVVAPAMTAILAAAASALDLTGEILTDDSAPDEHGVVFFPEPIYQRDPDGGVHAIGALTWTRVPAFTGLGIRTPSWMVASWSDLHDPHDPNSATIRESIDRDPRLAAETGPYQLVDCDLLPIGQPPSSTSWSGGPDEAQEWQKTPDGRCVIDTIAAGTLACSRLVYAYWRISSQPLATVANPPLDRPARRRAARASIVHDTRVVMLRRTSPVAEHGDGEAKWHYRVRFVVKGHWRRLVDKQGQPYRVWVQAHIKGPDGAPLLLGEKVAVLAR